MISKHLTGRFFSAPANAIAGDKSRRLQEALAERDSQLEQLTQTIAGQEAEITNLRDALKQGDFTKGILEQSYATQLEEARARAETAEQSIIDQQEKIAELEASLKKVRMDLADAKSRLDLFGPEAGSIDEMLESFSKPKEHPTVNDDEIVAQATAEPDSEMLPPEMMFAAKRKESPGRG